MYYYLGNFRKDSCNYSPSSSPDVINVGGTQQAEDEGRSGNVTLLCTCVMNWQKILVI